MKIKRFFAKDIRQAMRMVKDELGADAVIMSNRSVDGGVEIVAAQDFDAQAMQSQASPSKTAEASVPEQANAESKKPALTSFEAAKKHLHLLSSSRKQNADTTKSGSDLYAADRPAPARAKPSRLDVEQYVGYAEKVQLRSKTESSIAPVSHFEPPANRPQMNQDLKAAVQPETLSSQLSDKLLIEMSMELKSLRAAFDTKLSGALNSSAPATPFRMDLLQKLMGMSISKRLGIKIANQLTGISDHELAFTKAQDILAKSLPIAEDDLLENGGIAALVGPTGAGKTTTIAKLAAKFILRHGSRQVALITTDNYRIGAYEQLNTYGRILDIPVRVATNAAELNNLINSFSDKRLILIDTAGMSQRDMKLAEQINTLKQSNIPIRSYLVMSAATEYKAMNEIIKAFKIFEPQASILTKLDESATLGSAISAITEQNLPLFFITDGQQVPEDLHKPCARSLVKQCAAELHKENDYTDDLNDSLWVAQGYA
ncbi:MAG: flagellar biosynthesis protein FlhF [Methylovulum sp.]|jgi:flagellar biosynthesis protein FlhF|nr:flagellar biosynthesis protein FlhF [Methylovulum sp.]MCF7998248.1 flagellar biosynthesis protein FlhF [Methylovulum sp.]